MGNTLGERIRETRQRLCLTQKELSAMSGVPITTISCYEANKSDPSLFKLTCIADVLGVSLDWLANRTGGNNDYNSRRS